MQLTKIYRIVEVHGTDNTYQPYRLILMSKGDVFRNNLSKLSLDQATVERQKIPLSLDLGARDLLCTLTSRRLARCADPGPAGQEFSYLDLADLKPDDLIVQQIDHQESWGGPCLYAGLAVDEQFDHCAPSASITLASCEDEDKMPPISRPTYELVVELSEDEYQACIKMPIDTVFALQFSVLPLEPAPE